MSQTDDNISRAIQEQPSYTLQEYLRAEPTVSERYSGAAPGDNNARGNDTHLAKAAKQVEDFENAWKKN